MATNSVKEILKSENIDIGKFISHMRNFFSKTLIRRVLNQKKTPSVSVQLIFVKVLNQMVTGENEYNLQEVFGGGAD